jgi:hypothetical protein
MAIYGDDKHNNENTEHVGNRPTFKVSLTFEGVDGKNPLAVAKEVVKWLKDEEDGAENMTFDVVNEVTGEKFTVDLAEEDEDAVLPVKE